MKRLHRRSGVKLALPAAQQGPAGPQGPIGPTGNPGPMGEYGVSLDWYSNPNEANDVAKASGRPLIGYGEYNYTDTVNITAECELGGATFLFNDDAINPALLVGGRTAGIVPAHNMVMNLPKVVQQDRAFGSGLWSKLDVGVEIANTQGCIITMHPVEHFSTNLWLSGYGEQGTGYNLIYLTALRAGFINLLIKPGDINGWANKNTIQSGELRTYDQDGIDIPGSRQILVEYLGTHYPNQNRFIQLALEGNAMEYAYESIRGRHNILDDCRYERITNPRVKLTDTIGEQFMYGYDCSRIQFTESNARDTVWKTSQNSKEGSTVFENFSGGSLPAIAVANPGLDVGAAPIRHQWQVSATFTEHGQIAETFPRSRIDHLNRRIDAGPGSSAVDISLILRVVGTPEGVITAGPGSMALSTNGSIYRKATGTGNTGWVVMT